MECNKYMNAPFHQGSCVLARYAYAAEQQGNYWEVASKFYLTQPMTDYDVWLIAIKSGLNLDKFKSDSMSAAAREKVLSDIDEAVSLKIKGTPAVRLNNSTDVKMGAMSEFELKDYLIKAGAKEKIHGK
jgi:protein-disulfide isomerase